MIIVYIKTILIN